MRTGYLIIGGTFFFLMGAIVIGVLCNPDPKGVYVETVLGHEGHTGTLSFHVNDRWGYRNISFQDEEFNGTLDRVVAVEGAGQEKQFIKPGQKDWAKWKIRYLQVRTEAANPE